MVKLETTGIYKRLHIGSSFTDLSEDDYSELKRIFAEKTQGQRCALVEIDKEILDTCIEMYKSGNKLTAIKWLIEEAKRINLHFGIKWAREYFEGIGLEPVQEVQND